MKFVAVLSSSALCAIAACGGSDTGPHPVTPTGTHPVGHLSDSLTVSGRPHGVAIASSGRFCVSQIDGNQVTCGMLTAATATIDEPNVSVGTTPAHVALKADGSEAYTANQTAGTASFVDVTHGQTVGTVTLTDGGFNLLAHPSEARLYVTTAAGNLHVINTSARTVITHLGVGPAANGLALDTRANRLYVSSRDAGTVTAINTSNNTIAHTYAVAASPQRLALSADGKTLYVATESAGLEYLDLASGTHTAIPGVSTGAVGLALSPDNQRLYVANPPAGTVQIVDVAQRTVVGTLSGLGRPRNVAFGLDGAAALVTNEFGKVYVVR